MELTIRDKSKRVKSARPRKTYIDKELEQKKERMTSKEDKYKNIFYAKNRYGGIADYDKESLHKYLQYQTNTQFLQKKINIQNEKFEKDYKKMKLEEYSERVKMFNKAKVEEQRKYGIRPGMYTAQLMEKAQREK